MVAALALPAIVAASTAIANQGERVHPGGPGGCPLSPEAPAQQLGTMARPSKAGGLVAGLPEVAGQRPGSTAPAAATTAAAAAAAQEVGSPTGVAALQSSAASQQSSGPTTPLNDEGGSGAGGSSSAGDRNLTASPVPSLNSPGSDASGDLQPPSAAAAAAEGAAAGAASAAAAASPSGQQQQQQQLRRGGSPGGSTTASSPRLSGSVGSPRLTGSLSGGLGSSSGLRREVPVHALLERLQQRPLTGQVAAWAWDAAAALSGVRRTMPAQLLSALWPATEACIFRMMPQDVLEMMESWLTLQQQCPRHFRLSQPVLTAMATYALPAAVKRMGEDQLAQLARLARDIALHRSDADMQVNGPRTPGASARDLMQPVFALAAAETAWRCCNPARYVSPETVSAMITAAPAWSWRVVRYRDSQALAALKMATSAALEELRPHSPRDLSPSAFGKLKTSPDPRRSGSAAGSTAGCASEASTPRGSRQ